jgi:hypothetical protein
LTYSARLEQPWVQALRRGLVGITRLEGGSVGRWRAMSGQMEQALTSKKRCRLLWRWLVVGVVAIR